MVHFYKLLKWLSFGGPVAQLGARFHGMEEVVSSNLTRSTKYSSPKHRLRKCLRASTSPRRSRGVHLESNFGRRAAAPRFLSLGITTMGSLFVSPAQLELAPEWNRRSGRLFVWSVNKSARHLLDGQRNGLLTAMPVLPHGLPEL